MTATEIQGLRVRTNGKIEKIYNVELGEMQRAVGGYIELLPIDEKLHGFSVYINEEGRVKEQPLNMSMSLFLLRNNVWPGLDTPIHGDVLILGPVDEDGESTSVPDDLFDRLPKFWIEPKFEFLPIE
jgi:hypothetical protein